MPTGRFSRCRFAGCVGSARRGEYRRLPPTRRVGRRRRRRDATAKPGTGTIA